MAFLVEQISVIASRTSNATNWELKNMLIKIEQREHEGRGWHFNK